MRLRETVDLTYLPLTIRSTANAGVAGVGHNADSALRAAIPQAVTTSSSAIFRRIDTRYLNVSRRILGGRRMRGGAGIVVRSCIICQ